MSIETDGYDRLDDDAANQRLTEGAVIDEAKLQELRDQGLSSEELDRVVSIAEKLGAVRSYIPKKKSRKVLIPICIDISDIDGIDSEMMQQIADFKMSLKLGGKRKDQELVRKILSKEEHALAEYVKVGLKLGEIHWMTQRIAWLMAKLFPLSYGEEAKKIKSKLDSEMEQVRLLMMEKKMEASLAGVKEFSLEDEEAFYKLAVTDMWRNSFVHIGVDLPKRVLVENLEYIE